MNTRFRCSVVVLAFGLVAASAFGQNVEQLVVTAADGVAPTKLGPVLPLVATLSAAVKPSWRFEIVDAKGDPTPARVVATDPAKHTYLVPEGSLSWLMNDQPGRYRGAEYFYTDGAFTLGTSADTLDLYVRKGL